MIFSEIKCHVNTSLGLVGGKHPLHPSPCARACRKPKVFKNKPDDIKIFYNRITDRMLKNTSESQQATWL